MALTRLLQALVVLCILFVAGTSHAARVSNVALNFSFEPPIGFEEAPTPSDRVLYSYAQITPSGRLTVIIERLGRAIGKERVGLMGDAKKFQSMLGSKATTSNKEMKWGPHTISVLRTGVDNPLGQFVVLQAQVPLEPEAISVTIGGPLIDESSMTAILKRTVDSIQGETSWESHLELMKKLLVPALILLLAATWWLYIRYSKET